MNFSFRASFLSVVLSLGAFSCTSNQATAQASTDFQANPPPDIASLALGNNTHPLTRASVDQGPVSDTLPLKRMLLVLKRTTTQERALRTLIEQQQDKTSPNYHRWLTPQSFGAAFGPSDRDLATVTAWLAAHNFTGIHANAGRTLVEFSGTAGDLKSAFHTQVHQYLYRGASHLANASDPQLPAALAPIVHGIASLNDFSTQPSPTTPRAATADTASPNYTTTSYTTVYAVTPYDFATIYNVTPLWHSSIDGTGQTIAVVGQSEIDPDNFVNFRSLFNLPVGDTTGPTHTEFLNFIYNGVSPGFNGYQLKGDSDTQWAGAIAKGATIDYVLSQTTTSSQGSDLSAVYIVDNNLAPILVDTFTQCESAAGNAYNTFISQLWQQAAAQGITVVTPAGDTGSAGCDASAAPAASQGLAVNALASTPYNVAVGGTDFYMPNGAGAFWNPTNDPTTHASAKSYVPEETWNDSCTNTNLPANGTFRGLSPEQVCNSANGSGAGLLNIRAGGGGASSCAVSTGGVCTSGYPKPAWQSAAGVPADRVRDLPDLSFFSGDGSSLVSYFVCEHKSSGAACSLGTPYVDFTASGGTSFSAAAFAGVVALINQKQASLQGNANYTLYALARQQQASATACDSIASPSGACLFNDITHNTNSVPCLTGSPNCTTTTPTDTYGILSGYTAAAGFDQATGLGSVNVANLVNGWGSVSYSATTTQLGLSAASIVHGNPVTATVRVTSPGGTPTGQVSINASATNGSLGDGTLSNGAFTGTYNTFPGGTYQVHAYYGGDTTFAPSQSVPVNLTVTPENSTTTLSVADDAGRPVSSAPYGALLTFTSNVSGVSGQGIPSGNVNFTHTGSSFFGGIYRLNSLGTTQFTVNSLSVESLTVTANYVGDPSFNASASAPYPITVTVAPTTTTITPSTTSASDSGTVTFSIQVNTTGYGAQAPTGTVTLTANGATLGTVPIQSGSNGGSGFDYSFATITLPGGSLPSGTQVTASYPGDMNYAPSTGTTGIITVSASGLPATTTTLSLNPTVVAPRGTIAFTASVTSAASPVTAGNVQFAIDGLDVGTLAPISSTGAATEQISVSAFNPGGHVATAVFTGEGSHQSSISGSQPFTITSGSMVQSRTTIAVSPVNVIQGAPINIQVTVTPGTPVPTGNLQLIIDGNSFGAPGTLGADGTASFTLDTSTIQPGQHTVFVNYMGDTNYVGSPSTTMNFFVSAPGATPTTIVLSNIPAIVAPGTIFTFNATIAPNSPAPAGVLQLIIDGGAPLATPIQADPQPITLNTTRLSVGLHTLSVFYPGDIDHPAASSAPATFRISQNIATVTLSGVPATIPPNSSFTFQAAISPSSPVPTGTLQLVVDSGAPRAAVALQSNPQSFTFSDAGLAPGAHTLTILYSGDNNFAPAGSAPSTFQIVLTVPTLVLSGVPATTIPDSSFSFTATLSPSTPAPAGAFQIIVDSGAPQASIVVAADPQTLTLSTAGLSLGTHTVKVLYSGDGDYTSVTSAPVSFSVITPNSSFTLTPSVVSAQIPYTLVTSSGIVFTATPTAGGVFPVTFACSGGVPPGVSCTFTPVTINLNHAAATTTLILTNGVAVAGNGNAPAMGIRLGAGISVAALCFLILPRRRRLRPLLALFALIAVQSLSGCGSGVRPPRGPFPITVTATSGPSAQGITTQTATVNLTLGN